VVVEVRGTIAASWDGLRGAVSEIDGGQNRIPVNCRRVSPKRTPLRAVDPNWSRGPSYPLTCRPAVARRSPPLPHQVEPTRYHPQQRMNIIRPRGYVACEEAIWDIGSWAGNREASWETPRDRLIWMLGTSTPLPPPPPPPPSRHRHRRYEIPYPMAAYGLPSPLSHTAQPTRPSPSVAHDHLLSIPAVLCRLPRSISAG
jgi:hypothetical protein